MIIRSLTFSSISPIIVAILIWPPQSRLRLWIWLWFWFHHFTHPLRQQFTFIMKSSKVGFFPILGNYRQEHLRRIERRYLSERVSLPSEIQENRPVFCSDGEDFIRTKFPNFPAIYRDSAVKLKLYVKEKNDNDQNE